MFDNIVKLFKNFGKKDKDKESSDTAKERLHLVLMQDRANVSADFLELMKQEIIEVIKKYIDVDEKAIDVRLTNKTNEDGTVGAPALYANIPITTINENVNPNKQEEKKEDPKATEKQTEENEEEKTIKTTSAKSQSKTAEKKTAKKEVEETEAKKDKKTTKTSKDIEKEEIKEDAKKTQKSKVTT